LSRLGAFCSPPPSPAPHLPSASSPFRTKQRRARPVGQLEMCACVRCCFFAICGATSGLQCTEDRGLTRAELSFLCIASYYYAVTVSQYK
jgi:hypothetical protein